MNHFILFSAFLSVVSLPPVYPIDRIQAGQKGECRTVFEGDLIEPFEFVVKGLMEDYLGPGRDLVLIRLVGEKPEFTGVVSGMSGSPCTIEGKLVGALGYAFSSFAKEPIAGITPIADMVAVTKLPQEDRPWRLPPGTTSQWEAFEEGSAPVMEDPFSQGGLTPIATPLSMTGVTPALRKHFEKWFRAMGFEPVAGASSGGSATRSGPKRARPFEPGSAITAVMVSGDVNMMATGTVTTVEGDVVTAFGHPFMGTGASSIPMGTATILNTMVSMNRSFKMAAGGEVVGELTQDRLPAIAGVVGRFAKTISVKGSVKTPAGKDTFQLQVARDLGRSPYLVAMGIASAISGRLDVGKRGLLRYDAVIHVKGADSIRWSDVVSGEKSDSMVFAPAVQTGRAVATIWQTPFHSPPDISIELDVRYETTPHEEVVESIFIDRPQASPGERVELAVRLKKAGGGTSLERFSMTVPVSWAGKRVDFAATDADMINRMSLGVGGAPQPESLEQLVRWVDGLRVGGYLYVVALRHGVGMRSEVDVLPFLPPSAAMLISRDATRELNYQGMAWEKRVARPGTVAGLATTSLQVLRY